MIKAGMLIIFILCIIYIGKLIYDIIALNNIVENYDTSGLTLNQEDLIFTLFVIFIVACISLGLYVSI